VRKTETKICTKCGKETQLINFYKDKSHKDGLRSICKDCDKETDKKRRALYYETHKDKMTEYSRKYFETNKKHMHEIHKNYDKNNKEIIAERKKKYYKNNTVRIAKVGRTYVLANKDSVNKYKRQYRKNNPDKTCIYAEKRRAIKLQLPHTLTTQQWRDTKQYFNNRCCYCNRELPLTQEHFIAVSKGGEYTKKNILPSCGSCNSSKGTKLFDLWYPKYRYFSKERELKILKYLGGK